jgi:toxin ParE1/3/4
VSYALLVRRQAKSDLQRAAKWYEKQRTGLGREFVSEVERTLRRVADNPFLYQEIPLIVADLEAVRWIS